jgi:DNA-binding NarL/FixJ family response regulator
VIRVLITDDHAILRKGLKDILMRGLEGAECGETDDAEQVVARVQNRDGMSSFWTSPCRGEVAWMS